MTRAQDFANGLPSDVAVAEGELDHFSTHGRAKLLIDMIHDVASDLVSPDGAHYDETLAWVKDAANLSLWLEIVNVSESVIPHLQEAFLERAAEVKLGCENLTRSNSRTEGSLDRVLEMFEMTPAGSESSLCYDDDSELAWPYRFFV